MLIYSSTCENWLWVLDYITSKQHTKLYTQTVQGLADYAQKIHALYKPGSTQPFAYVLYSEQLDGARLLAIIMPPNCSHALIVRASVRILCC